MADTISQIQEARSQGHSDQEIMDYLTANGLIDPNKVNEALNNGNSLKDVLDYFSPPSSVNTKFGKENSIFDSPLLVNTPPGADIDEHTGESIAGPTSQAGVALGTGAAIEGGNAVASATLPAFLRGLAASAVGGGVARKGAEWLHLPGWAQTGAELIGAAAGGMSTGKLEGLLHEYAKTGNDFSLHGFLDFLGKRNAPELPIVQKAIGVTGGTPVEPSPLQPNAGDPNAIPGPGFSGTRLSQATGRGGNSQTPLPALPKPRPIIEGPNSPSPSQYTFTGGKQFQIPGVGDIMESTPPTTNPAAKGAKTPVSPSAVPSPTPPIPTPPTGVVVSGVRPGYEGIATKVAENVADSTYNKAVAIAKYLRDNNIDPTSVVDRPGVARTAGYPRGASDATWQQVLNEHAKLPAPTSVPAPSNNESPTPLEDTLQKSITKAKAAKTSPTPSSTPTPNVPKAPTPTDGGGDTFVYGDTKSPNYEFKRLGSGQWGQRSYNSGDAFSPVIPALSADLEDNLKSGSLISK